MEFAAAALSSLAGPTAMSATSAAGTFATTGTLLLPGSSIAAGAGGGALAALGQTSLWASILQGGATVASVLAHQRAGELEARKLEFQAQDAETESQVEEIKGLERRNSIKAALVEALGERDVAAAASGIDLTFGTPAIARREAVRDAERALDVDRGTEEFRKQRLRERASSYRLAASEARSGGLLRAAGTGLTGAAALLRRG